MALLILGDHLAACAPPDVAPDELASYCLHALTAAATRPSEAAVHRLADVTRTGLHSPRRQIPGWGQRLGVRDYIIPLFPAITADLVFPISIRSRMDKADDLHHHCPT
ncbi:hypothetical protein Mth01_54050 [Sphaerimonospora thailandensis]|uniref:Uncharacterized protein n=1 Tax=Sphaerimonospora thailandensis TaxID=795644 RepID=A0A8J3RFX2_9ACTN|nr:hypothetical protein Mth01_54050 [Sphaerimonospora thailandensis]